MNLKNWIAIVPFLLVACEKNELYTLDESSEQVQLITQIGEMNPTTRVSLETDGKGKFLEEDQISLLYGQGLQKNMTLKNAQWTPSFSWSEVGESSAFSAFYPAIPDNGSSTFRHVVQLDQRKGDNFERSALLYAAPVQVQKGEPVHLQFNHLMSCITVNLKGNLYTQDQLANAVIKLKAYNEYEVQRDGTLKHLYDYNDKITNIPEITLKHCQGTTFQAVVCPQKLDISFRGWLTIQINGKTYSVAEPPEYLSNGEPFQSFKSGQNVTFTYSFNHKVPTGKPTRIMVSGVQIPDPQTSADWKDLGGGLIQLPWNNSYSWYDCDKKMTTNDSYNDQNLCWAAASSNMLHWWFDYNRENVERYCQVNGIDINTLPHKYTDHHNSEIFDCFKQNFTNKGSFIRSGLKWFLSGVYEKLNTDAADLKNAQSGGFFKDVFGTKSMTQYQGIGSSLEDFSAFLKEGLENDMAVGFNIFLKGFGFKAHAMTIWGAEFDEYGLVTDIYYVENNDGTLDSGPNPAGLIKSKIAVYDSNVCMQGSTGEIKIKITALVLLKSGKEEWAAYFKTHPGK